MGKINRIPSEYLLIPSAAVPGFQAVLILNTQHWLTLEEK